jgi:hypothetical protein
MESPRCVPLSRDGHEAIREPPSAMDVLGHAVTISPAPKPRPAAATRRLPDKIYEAPAARRVWRKAVCAVGARCSHRHPPWLRSRANSFGY